MLNEYEREGYFDDDLPELPEYEEIPPTPEQIAYAQSLVGKWAISRQGYPYGRCLGKVLSVGKHYPNQIELCIFRSSKMWDFRYWTLMWQESVIQDISDSFWWAETKERPTIKERLGRLAHIICRYPVKKFCTYKFDCRTYTKFGHSIVHPDYFESLITAFWDVGIVMRFGWTKLGKWNF